MGKGKGSKRNVGVLKTSSRRERRRKKNRAETAHDSTERLAKRRHSLRLKTLLGRVEREDHALRNWSGPPPAIVLKSGVDRRQQKGILRGAARPWGAADPTLRTPKIEKPTVDLLAKHAGRCFECPEARLLCCSLLELGCLLLVEGTADKSAMHLRSLLELDGSDSLGARPALVRALIDSSEDLSEARAVIDRAVVTPASATVAAELLWSRALIEFVSWSLLGESDDGGAAARAALQEARLANPNVATMLGVVESFKAVVDPDQIDERAAEARGRALDGLRAIRSSEPGGGPGTGSSRVAPSNETILAAAHRAGECTGGGEPQGGRGEAVAYVASSLGVWADADGACAWAAAEAADEVAAVELETGSEAVHRTSPRTPLEKLFEAVMAHAEMEATTSAADSDDGEEAAGEEAHDGGRLLRLGVHVLELRIGTGPKVGARSTVSVSYVGRLDSCTGPVFDKSGKRPLKIRLGAGGVIPGFDIGLKGMRVGGVRRLTCPPEAAYGERSVAGIPRNSTLCFDVECHSVK